MTFRRPAAAAVLLAGLLALVPLCRAQRPDDAKQQQSSYGLGTEAFRRLLFELRFQPLESFAELEENPSESLFIMLGDPSCLSRQFFREGLRSFVERGGAVLIATDKETRGNAGKELSKLAGVRVTGETLICVVDSEQFYHSPYCPFVRPIEDSINANGSTSALRMAKSLLDAGSRPALFRNPNPDLPALRVATNAPSQLLRGWWLGSGLHPLAHLPTPWIDASLAKKSLDGSLHLLPVRPMPPPLFAVGGIAAKGRVLVLADHSIFINRMILPPDLGNLEFAANCLHWLRGGISSPIEALRAVNRPDALRQLTGQRNKVLLWDDGRVNTRFEVPLKNVPLPPPPVTEPAVVAAVDKTLAKLEDSNFFNRKLGEAINSTQEGFEGVLRGGIYLLTLAAGLLLAYLFVWRLRYQREPAFPLLAETIDGHQPTLSVLDQRRRAQLRSGNVWEMGHRLAREYFESAGIALTAASPPRVRLAQGGWRRRWRVQRRLARLWRLARGDSSFPLSPAALKRRLRDLDELKTALANGTMVLNAELTTDNTDNTDKKV